MGMESKKQTAVEWLINELGEYFPHQIGGIHLMIEQAKEMEKQLLVDAHFEGCKLGEMFNNENRAFYTDSKQYYNETFKQ
jgi:hypothetical protein